MTVSFKFRLFARRVVSGTNCIGIRSGNLLSFATTTDGHAVYFDLDNQGFDIPAPGGYSESSGWHAVMVSFDSATGVLQAYFDGQLGVNKTGFKQGKSSAGTFGPGLSSLRLAAPVGVASRSTVPRKRVPPCIQSRWYRVVCGLGVWRRNV